MFGSPPAGRDGDFAEFARSAATRLTRTAYLLSGNRDTASDLVQEALVRTYVAWPRVRRDEALAYARRVLVNLTIDQRRRGGAIPMEIVDRATFDPAESRSDDRDELVRMLATLSETQRRVIVLRYFDDLTEAAVAEHLGISLGTVKSACSRGLDSLRKTYTLSAGGER
jgi:RNA polymerase sigma-70 factor (sigma-E family)